jgi:hypothetical protein
MEIGKLRMEILPTVCSAGGHKIFKQLHMLHVFTANEMIENILCMGLLQTLNTMLRHKYHRR